MKTLLTIIMGALAITVLSSSALAQNEPPQQEAKIVHLEEVTALIVQDSTGSIVRRIPVSGRAEYNLLRREERIRNPLKAGESMRSEIPDPRVEFRDENGMVVKSISLKDELSTRTETRNIGGREETYSFRQGTGSTPIINKNGAYLLLVKTTGEVSNIEPNGRVVYYEGSTSPTQLTYYDVRGNVLFEKLLPKGVDIGSLSGQLISDDGAVIASHLNIDLPVGFSEGFIVLNKSGIEIISLIKGKPSYLSPDGKYLAVWVNNITRFYNTTNQQYWDSPARYLVYSITADGLARIEDLKTFITTEIDLKAYIKE